MEPVGYVIGNNGVDELIMIANPKYVDGIKLFDYVYYEHGDSRVLAQVIEINRELYRVSESLAPVVFNDGVKPVETVLIKLLIIGKKTGDLLRLPEAPPPVSTPVYLADPELVKSYLGLRGRLCIGYLASMQDVKVCLNEKAISRHMAIIGATGNGKTWLSVLVIEELLKLGATVLILDPHGEYVKAKDTVSKMDGVGLTVFRLSKHHVGDLTYRVGLMTADPDHIASVSGIDDKAIRIREAFSLAHRCVKLAAKAYGDPKLATLRNMERILTQVASGRRIQFDSLQNLFGTKYPTGNLSNDNKYFRRLKSVLTELNNLADESAGRHAALAAKRYVRKLRRLGVYAPLSTRLFKLLKVKHAAIINLAGLDDSVQDHVAYSILNRVLKARINYVRRLPGPKYPYPVVIVVEEAHRFAPGNGKKTLTYSVLSRIAMEGRKFGVFLVLITQRPSKIDQDILSQVQNYALLKIVNPKDREALLEAGELMNSNLDKILASLNIGESLIMGPVVGGQVPIIVKLRNRVLEYGGGDINLDKYWGVKEEDYGSRVSMMMGLKIPKLTIERAKLLLDKISDESLNGSVIRGYVNGARVEVDLKNEVWSCSKCKNSMKPCEHVVALLLKKAMNEAELMRK